MFGLEDIGREIYNNISIENATASDIEDIIKECFDHYDIKYDYIKVEVL